jgi:large exoprotein involved in heme utilization and adhesion
VTGKSVKIGPFAAIAAQTFGAGDGGSILVCAGTLKFKQGYISLTTLGTGAGGNATIFADSVVIDGGAGTEPGGTTKFATGIFARAVGQDLQHHGNGGDITVTANDLVLQNGGAISTESSVSAAAGSVRLSLGTLGMDTNSLVSSANTSSGEAGSVMIETTGSVTVKDASSISTLSTRGDAGSIDIMSGGEIKLKDQSSITASAGVNGGSITIMAPGQFVYLLDSSITATAGSSGSSGTGGNITLDGPQFIVLNNSLISANATAGQGGNIDLISDFFFNSNSLITATGTTNGIVNITAPALDLGAQLITLPTSLLNAQNQLQERCTALLYGDFSSFISIGRGGTEVAPEELQTTF